MIWYGTMCYAITMRKCNSFMVLLINVDFLNVNFKNNFVNHKLYFLNVNFSQKKTDFKNRIE